MAIDYKRYEFRTYEYIVRLESALANFNIIDDRLPAVKSLIESHKFQVAVMGEFKRGKSTLINALLGQEVLPVDATPATATLNRVTYGNHPRAILEYKDGRKQEVAVDELAEYVTKITKHSENNARQIRQAIVQYPTIFCQNDVDIIDTPGLQDVEEMTAITIQNIRDVDLAIIAISARFPFSDTECSFIVQLLEAGTITKLVIMVTYIDTVDSDEREEFLDYLGERIKNSVLKKLRDKYPSGHDIYASYERTIGELEMFPVSSKLALKAKKTGDVSLLEESGIQRVQRELTRLFLANRRNNVVIKGVGTIQAVSEHILMNDPQCIEDIKKTILRLQQEKSNILSRTNKYKVVNNANWENAKSELKLMVNCISENLNKDLMGRFIHRLSNVRERNSIAVEIELRQEIKESFQYVSDKYNKPFITELQNKLNILLDECKVKYDVMLHVAKPQFGWCISPMPQARDLIRYEVMDHVKTAIEESTKRYIESCNSFIQNIEEELEKSQEYIEEEIKKQRMQEIENNISGMKSELEEVERKWMEEKVSIRQIQIESKNMLEEFYGQIKEESM